MTESLAEEAVEHRRPAAEAGEHGAHPTDAQYMLIALILAVLTGIEVGIYYLKINQRITNGFLLILAGFKFVIVAAYFMHLKFDNKILRRVFTTGFVLASFCYIAYMLTLGVFVGR